MNALPFFAVVMACANIVSGQTQMSDEMIRKLGGDPVALREEALKRQKEAPSAEDVALRERAATMAETITDEKMASLTSDDPLVRALYERRLRLINHTTTPILWTQVIDRDIRRRKEAPALFEQIFESEHDAGGRLTSLEWLDVNRDVEWGNSIMEAAINSYRANPQKWGYSVTVLRRLVAGRGNESHLAFFDLLDKTEFGSGNDRGFLEHRIKMAKEKTTPAASSTKPITPGTQLPKPTQQVPLGQTQRQRKENSTRSTEWGVGAVTVIAAIGLLWLFLKPRK